MEEEDGDGAAACGAQPRRDLRAARSDDAVWSFGEVLSARGYALLAMGGARHEHLAALAARRGRLGAATDPRPGDAFAGSGPALPPLDLGALRTARVTEKVATPVIRAVLPPDAPDDAIAVRAGVPRGATYLVFLARGDALHMDAARTILAACDAAGATHAAVLTEFELSNGTRSELRTKGVACEDFLIARLVRNPLLHALVPRYTLLAPDAPEVLAARRGAGARQLPCLPFDDIIVRLLGLPAGALVLEEPRAGWRVPLSACVREVVYTSGSTTPFADLRPPAPAAAPLAVAPIAAAVAAAARAPLLGMLTSTPATAPGGRTRPPKPPRVPGVGLPPRGAPQHAAAVGRIRAVMRAVGETPAPA